MFCGSHGWNVMEHVIDEIPHLLEEWVRLSSAR